MLGIFGPAKTKSFFRSLRALPLVVAPALVLLIGRWVRLPKSANAAPRLGAMR